MTLLPIIQIILGLLLITGILLQQSEAGLGSSFGGDDGSGFKHTRRGAEKAIFNGTIVIAILFVASSIIALLL